VLYEIATDVNELKRAAAREERAIERGYPPDYYSLPADEQRRVGARIRQQRHRSKQQREPIGTPAVRGGGPVRPEQFQTRLAALRAWLTTPGHRQTKLKGRISDLMHAYVAREEFVASLGRAPSFSEFAAFCAARFGKMMTRRQAQNRLERVAELEAAGGPWTPKA
jgi:hypothetical protein